MIKITIHILPNIFFIYCWTTISYSMNNLCLKDLHDDSTGCIGWIN